MTAVLIVSALILVPGLGAALALAAPGALELETRLALVFGLGYALVAGVAIMLTLARVLSLAPFVAAVTVATVAVWALALRRASFRAHAEAVRSEFWEAPFAHGAGLAMLLALVVARATYSVDYNLSISSPWRYWADGLEIAAAGRVPQESAQWGGEIPTTVSKVVLNAFEGGVSLLLGPDPLPAMEAILAVVVVGLAAALLALGRELGLSIFAPLVPGVILFAPGWLPLSPAFSRDAAGYVAENVGRLGAFCGLVAGLAAIRAGGRWPLAMVSGLLLIVGGLSHLIPALIAGALLVLYALWALLQGPARPIAAALGVTAVTFVIGYLAIVGLAGGDLGFERATSGATFTELPRRVDPTVSFHRGAFARRERAHGRFQIPPDRVITAYPVRAVGSKDEPGWSELLFLVPFALATVLMLLLAPRLSALAVLAWGLAVTVVMVALAFSLRYSTQIPADFGVRRLYAYAGLLPGLLVPGLLEAIGSRVAARRPVVLRALCLVAGVLASALALATIARGRDHAEAEAGRQAIDRVASVVPCNGRMLANGRTAGTWEALTGRRAITEGMAPYLRPRLMDEILPRLVGARQFFKDPAEHADFLVRERVGYLVLVRPGAWVGTGGGRLPPTDYEGVAALPGVESVYADQRVEVFAVGDAAVSAAGSQPARCPL
jgi:hypothetical protein